RPRTSQSASIEAGDWRLVVRVMEASLRGLCMSSFGSCGRLFSTLSSGRGWPRSGRGRVPGLIARQRPTSRLQYPLKHPFHPVQDIVVTHSEHVQPLIFQELLADLVFPPPIVVASAVHLHDQSRLVAVEIHDVGADGMLPPELQTRETPAPQRTPQSALGERG